MSAAGRGKELPRPRLVVGFEACSPASSVALATVEGALLAQVWRERTGPASQVLLGDLDRMLTELGASKSDVAGIAVTLGPGAFTGLRVALALAKSLAHGWGVPLFGFSSLAMLARRWPAAGLAVALLDARRGEVYAGLYKITGVEAAAPEALLPDCVAPLETVMDNMEPLLGNEPVTMLGGGAVRYREQIEAQWGARVRFAPAELMQPAAGAVALAGACALRGGLAPLDPLCAEPVYLRASDAAVRHPEGVR